MLRDMGSGRHRDLEVAQGGNGGQGEICRAPESKSDGECLGASGDRCHKDYRTCWA